MKRSYWKKFAGVAGALSLLVMAACGANETAAPEPTEPNDGAVVSEEPIAEPDGIAINIPVATRDADGTFSLDHNTFLAAKTNVGEAIDGGVLNFGIVQNAPAAGVLNAVWGTTVPDTQIRQFFDEPMYQVGADLTMNQEGVATWELAEDGRTFTWTINENAYWSDGQPLTAQDWVFAHYVIADPDYTGVRFDSITGIVGVTEFHNGEADHIAGLRIIDDKTLEMEFIEASPSLLTGGVWANALPYHIFGEIPVGEMQDSEFIRETPIGFGPFVLNHVVTGESWSFVRNENYWRGTPNLDGVDVRIINNDVVGQELRAGTVDVINSFAASQVPYFFDLDNVEWIGTAAGSYSYISFNLGDFIDGEVIPREDHPANNVFLRRAIWHAADWDEVGRRLFSGLTWSADGIIPPSIPFFHATHLNRPEPSIEAARAAMEEGGFIMDDATGFFTNADGSELTLQFFASEPASDAAEAHLLFLIQSWQAAGINVELNTVEFVALTEMLTNNEPGIDMFTMGWGLGWDVDPTGRYGRHAAFNRAGYVSDELDELLAAINTEEAIDPQVRLAAMNAWQEYMLENVVVIPTTHSLTALPVNNRVLNFDLGSLGAMAGSGGGFWHEVALSSETGIVDGQ